MIRYRSFRNTDPPALADAWNSSCSGRGVYPLRSAAPLEFALFSKPYFDPEGLIIAEDEGRIVGFTHAGFGPDAAEKQLDRSVGVICVLVVRPEFRRQKIGTELLQRAESYLQRFGAKEFVAGEVKPYTPFYFGVYGNSNLPGFLGGDAAVATFLERHGYRVWETTLVLERQLPQMEPVVDQRFLSLRRRYDVQLVTAPEISSWWQDCVLGPIEPVEFRLLDKLSGIPSCRALVWDINAFRGGGFPIAGVLDLQVRPDVRRQGQARFLLSQMMRYLQDYFFKTIEMQCSERNDPCLQLLRGLGMEQVDVGRSYRKSAANADG